MKQKRGILYWLRVILAAASVLFLCYRCSEGWGIPVYADGPSSHPDSTHSVTLTPQQTVALYGSSFTALVGDRYSDSTSAITFQYAFPLKSVGFMDVGGGFSISRFPNPSLSIDGSSLTANEIKDIWCGSNGCVYVADSSQWGNSTFNPYDHDQMNGAVQLHIPFSIQLPSITRFCQNVFFSTKRNADYQTPYAFPQYNELKILTDIANVSFPSVRAQYSNYYVAARAVLPTYQYYQDGNQLDENNLGYFSGWEVDLYDDEDTPTFFSISGATIDCYCVSSVSRDNNNIWLVIGCPTLYNYNPPVTTTAGTTRPRETAVPATYPLATLDSGVTGPLVVINDNSITQINQLNMIIGQLNLIYAQLVANGEIAVDLGWSPDLQDGDSISIYGTDIKNQMETIINGHTTAALPNFNNDYVSSGFGFLMDQPWISMLGGLGLALSVACWIIFEGRH